MPAGCIKIDGKIEDCHIEIGWENERCYVQWVCIQDLRIDAEDFREWGIHEIYVSVDELIRQNEDFILDRNEVRELVRSTVLDLLSQLISAKRQTVSFPDVSPERCEELRAMDYRTEYLHTPEWKQRAEIIQAHFGNQCQTCTNDSDDVHHRTYDRRGNENPEDLIPLCRKCHNLIHDNTTRPNEDFLTRDNTSTRDNTRDIPF